MEQNQPNDDNGPDAKRMCLTHGNGQNEPVNAAVAAVQDQLADIFKLNFDCFAALFDWLSFEDLRNVSLTCKQMQHETGTYFGKRHLLNAVVFVGHNGGFWMNNTEVTSLIQFFRIIHIGSESKLRLFLNAQSKFHCLEEVRLCYIQLTNVNAETMKETFKKLVALELFDCDIQVDFHGNILQFCTNLQRLTVVRVVGIGSSWFSQKYDSLEYFRYQPKDESQNIQEVLTFLKLNPNISKFGTDLAYLWQNIQKTMDAGIKLDNLMIYTEESYQYRETDEETNDDDNKDEVMTKQKLAPFCKLLNELLDREFYKRLEMYFMQYVYDEVVEQMMSLNGLVKFYTREYEFGLGLSRLTNLEEIFVVGTEPIDDGNAIASNLTKLKRVAFVPERGLSFSVVVELIKNASNLQEIHAEMVSVYRFETSTYYDESTEIIDLLALNKLREKLPAAKKLTLFVRESVYMATKWAMNTDLDLIQLKRLTSGEVNTGEWY